MTLSLALRPTAAATDLELVLAMERHPDNAPWVGQWTRSRHIAAVQSDDEAHFMIEQPPSAQPLGYVICMGLQDINDALNIRRIVVTHKGKGHGRQALECIKAFAFHTAGAHRLWLDVMTTNHRARALYQRAGFITEGVLRDSWKTTAGYQSMVIMSMLRAEYLAQPPSGR